MAATRSKDGTSIAYDKTGQGPALVLVDGAFCYRQNGPAPKLVPLLAQQFTVYSYDRRGRGESSNGRPYAVDRELEDLMAVINAAGGSAFVVGVSSGAALAMHAAATGLPIEKLVLFEPPYVHVTPDDPVIPQDGIQQINQMVAADRRGDAVKYFLTKVMGLPSFVAFIIRFIPGVWARNKSVAHTLAYDLAILGDGSVPHRIAAAIQTPTLCLGGAKSPDKLRKAVQAVAAAIPNAELRLLEGQNHNASMSVLAPVISEYLNSPPQDRR